MKLGPASIPLPSPVAGGRFDGCIEIQLYPKYGLVPNNCPGFRDCLGRGSVSQEYWRTVLANGRNRTANCPDRRRPTAVNDESIYSSMRSRAASGYPTV